MKTFIIRIKEQKVPVLAENEKTAIKNAQQIYDVDIANRHAEWEEIIREEPREEKMFCKSCGVILNPFCLGSGFCQEDCKV